MRIKLVKSTSIKVGDKILYKGQPALVMEKVQTPYKNHFYFVTFNDLVFTRSDMKLLKVVAEDKLV